MSFLLFFEHFCFLGGGGGVEQVKEKNIQKFYIGFYLKFIFLILKSKLNIGYSTLNCLVLTFHYKAKYNGKNNCKKQISLVKFSFLLLLISRLSNQSKKIQRIKICLKSRNMNANKIFKFKQPKLNFHVKAFKDLLFVSN